MGRTSTSPRQYTTQEQAAANMRLGQEEAALKHKAIRDLGNRTPGSDFALKNLKEMTLPNGELDMGKIHAAKEARDFKYSIGGENMSKRAAIWKAQASEASLIPEIPQNRISPDLQAAFRRTDELNIAKTEAKVQNANGDLSILSKGPYSVRDANGKCVNTNYVGYCRIKAETSPNNAEKNSWLSKESIASGYKEQQKAILADLQHKNKCAKLGIKDAGQYSPEEIARHTNEQKKYKELEKLVSTGLAIMNRGGTPTVKQERAYYEVCARTGKKDPVEGLIELRKIASKEMPAPMPGSVIAEVGSENRKSSKTTGMNLAQVVKYNRSSAPQIDTLILPSLHSAAASYSAEQKSITMAPSKKEFFEQFRGMYRSGNIPSADQISFPQDIKELNSMKDRMREVMANSNLTQADKSIYKEFDKFLDRAIETKSSTPSPFA